MTPVRARVIAFLLCVTLYMLFDYARLSTMSHRVSSAVVAAANSAAGGGAGAGAGAGVGVGVGTGVVTAAGAVTTTGAVTPAGVITAAGAGGGGAAGGASQSGIIATASRVLQSLVNVVTPVAYPVILILIYGEVDKTKIEHLREMVGSIHHIDTNSGRSPDKCHEVIIVTENAAVDRVEEIRLWRRTQHHHMHELLTGVTGSTFKQPPGPIEQEALTLTLIDHFTIAKGAVLYVQAFHTFALDDRLVEAMREIMKSGVLFAHYGVMQGYTRQGFLATHGERLNCLRGFCNNTANKFKLPSWTPPESGKNWGLSASLAENYCHLAIRPEAMFSPLVPSSGQSSWSSRSDLSKFYMGTKPKICFGAPSRSLNGNPNDHPLIGTFLPSFMNSVTQAERDKYVYAIYVGYDHGDIMLDLDRENFDVAIHNRMDKNFPVAIKYQIVPSSHWLTYIWNSLFVDAMRDGCDYYYQTNDDIEFKSPGWSTDFVNDLEKNDGLGVAAPNDINWNCKLFTQAMVSRKHYAIFGWFYPLEIRDWYSDNWMTKVYTGTDTKCYPQHQVKNGKAGQRYHHCGNPPWQQAVTNGQTAIENYKKTKSVAAARR